MRILSQDNGKYDLPYENIVLEKIMDRNTIYAYAVTGKPFKMAVYSSTERMNKAMDMLQNTYYDSELSKFINDGTTFLTTHFRFPQDNEIEV